MRDHNPIKVLNFGGLFDRGEQTVVPFDHLIQSQNLSFLPRGFRTRPPSSPITATIPGSNILRQHFYVDNENTLHTLVLNEVGEIYDVGVEVDPILTIAEMTDFSIAGMYGRVYITPHDGRIGLEGEVVYVYENEGEARPAGGGSAGVDEQAPDNFYENDETNPGEVDPGSHFFAVAFETSTGFISPPTHFYDAHCTTGRQVTTQLPIGPAGTVARIIIVTKIVPDPTRVGFHPVHDHLNGTLQAPLAEMQAETYYYLPNGRIADNTTEDFEFGFFDVELVDEATELFEQLEEIPAGVAIVNYNGRLAVGGEFENPSLVRVSNAGDPERMHSITGLLSVNPGDSAYAVSNLWVHRESLIIHKVGRTYSSIDNGDDITTWPVDLVDSSIGAGPHSVGRIALFGQTLQDVGVIADSTGCYAYNGVFAGVRLSDKISDVWERINEEAAPMIDVVIDPRSRSIYVAVPLDAATRPSHILYGDYTNGLTPAGIRWSLWSLPYAPQSISVITTPGDDLPILRVASYGGALHTIADNSSTVNDRFPTTSDPVAINSIAQFALIPTDEQEDFPDGEYHFGGFSLGVSGSGNLNCVVLHEGSASEIPLSTLTLRENPGRNRFLLHNSVAPSASLKIETKAVGSFIRIIRLVQWVKFLWSVRDDE